MLGKMVKVTTYKKGKEFIGKVVNQYGKNNTIVKVQLENGDVLKFFSDLDEIKIFDEFEQLENEIIELIHRKGLECESSGNMDETHFYIDYLNGYDHECMLTISIYRDSDKIELSTYNTEREEECNIREVKTIKAIGSYIKKHIKEKYNW